MPNLQQYAQPTNGTDASSEQAQEPPQHLIRVYLDEHGPVRIPFRNLLVSWHVADPDRVMRARMATALADAGINLSRPLVDIEPEDEIELSSTGAENAARGLATAMAGLERAHAGYSAEFEEASQQFAAVEQRYLEAVTWKYREFEQAKCNRKLVSVGRRRVVHLHETVLRSGNAEFALSGEVSARVEKNTGAGR